MRVATAVIVLPVAVFVAACGRAPSMDESMKRDLEAASAGSIELAPRSGSQIVTAAEIVPATKPVVAPTRRTQPPAPAPRRETPAPAPVATEPSATRPVTTPRVSPPPPGGYKTVDEVIRNAPFPIKP